MSSLPLFWDYTYGELILPVSRSVVTDTEALIRGIITTSEF